MKNLIIREIEDSEISAAVARHNEYYEDARTQQQWEWEYQESYPGRSVFVVAKNDDEVVATQGMIPICLNVRGQKHFSGKSENSLVMPKFQGLLFLQMYNAAMKLCKQKKMNCVWAYTRKAQIWRGGLKFKVYDDVMYEAVLVSNPYYAFPEIMSKKWSVIVKAVIASLLIPAPVFSFVIRLFCFRKASVGNYEVEEKYKSIDHLADLYARLRKKNPDLIHLELNEQFLNWRIYHNPNINYRTLFLYEKDQLRAYCYFSRSAKNTVYISDFTFENESAGSFLLKHLLAVTRKETGIVYFLGNSKNSQMAGTFKLLKKYGFLVKKNCQAFVIKDLSHEVEPNLYDIRNWYTNGLWCEGYVM